MGNEFKVGDRVRYRDARMHGAEAYRVVACIHTTLEGETFLNYKVLSTRTDGFVAAGFGSARMFELDPRFHPAPHASPESFRQVFCAWTGQTPAEPEPTRLEAARSALYDAVQRPHELSGHRTQFVGDGNVEIVFSVCVPRHAAIACADSSATSYRVTATSKGDR